MEQERSAAGLAAADTQVGQVGGGKEAAEEWGRDPRAGLPKWCEEEEGGESRGGEDEETV